MPPPSRERLSRPVDISTLFRGAARTVDLKVDEPGLRWAGLSGDPARNSARRSRRSSRRWVDVGQENRTPGRTARSGRGRGRGRGRVLPHWYPRTPLRDITAIVRVIERRRAQLHLNDDDQATEAPQEEPPAPSSSSSTTTAQFEHESAVSVDPKLSPNTKVGKILANVTKEKAPENSNFITPQKRLLESIDEVGDVLVEERRKQEKTPAAKKAERQKKMRTLKSMR